MLLWLGEGRWWGEGSSSDPAIAVEWGRGGSAAGSVGGGISTGSGTEEERAV